MNEYFLNEKVIICKDTNEICKGYNEYLKSNHWYNLRHKFMLVYDFKCQKCKKTKKHYELQIHHKSYKNIGHEHKADIILLCEDCHKKVHIKKNKLKVKKSKRKRNSKYKCKYFEIGKCKKFNCKCFDCKEYKNNKNYLI